MAASPGCKFEAYAHRALAKRQVTDLMPVNGKSNPPKLPDFVGVEPKIFPLSDREFCRLGESASADVYHRPIKRKLPSVDAFTKAGDVLFSSR